VVHLESVLSHTPRWWQGSHASGGASRAVAVVHPTIVVARAASTSDAKPSGPGK